MKSVLIALLMSAAAVTPSMAQRKQTVAFRIDATAAIRIWNLVGVTKVTGWDRDSVHAIAAVPAKGGNLFGGGRGGMAKLGIEAQDPSLAGPESNVEVMVPRNARIWIKSASAKVTLVNLTGEVEVTSVTGSIDLTGAPRVATFETIDGDVTIDGSATVVRARTGAGSVRISGARGDLSITTVQGGITIDSPELLSARLETVSGPVEVRAAAISLDGRLDVEAHDGRATVLVPRSIDARFELSSVKGTITAPLVGKSAPATGERALRFSIGKKAGAGRGATITVRTFSGDIKIDSNPPGS